jgi:MarR family transcriptional regulator, organic hydroperoxide resistance regulator
MASATVTRRAQERREQRLLELGAAFRSMFRALNRVRGRDTHLGGSDLSHAQFQLLRELQEHGDDVSAGELAAAAQLAPATVTQMLDHLAASGDVERVRSEKDRRVVVTRLTPQGASRIEAKREAWKQRWQLALDDVGEDQLAAASVVLERLAEMFEQTAAGDGSERPETASQSGSQAAEA